MKKIERNIIRRKIEGKSPRVVLYFDKERVKLIQSQKNDPIRANLLLSYVLLIEDCICNMNENERFYWNQFLDDIKKVFRRKTKTDELEISEITTYLKASFKDIYFCTRGEIKKYPGKSYRNFAEKDLPIPIFLLGFFFEALASKRYRKTLRRIMVCKLESCQKLYANNRKDTCSSECAVKFHNNKKSEKKYFKSYRRSPKSEYQPSGKYKKKSGKLL